MNTRIKKKAKIKKLQTQKVKRVRERVCGQVNER